MDVPEGDLGPSDEGRIQWMHGHASVKLFHQSAQEKVGLESLTSRQETLFPNTFGKNSHRHSVPVKLLLHAVISRRCHMEVKQTLSVCVSINTLNFCNHL